MEIKDSIQEIKEFNKIELLEKEGKGILKIDGVVIKGLTGYSINRGTDTVDITTKISVPEKNFKTIEN